MFDFIIYLGQSALCLAALYLIYKVAMSHETLHYFNRVLLLGSVLLSALLPLCRVKIVKEYDPAPTLASIEIDDMVVADVADVALGIDYVSLLKDLAVIVFFVGMAFMLVRLAAGIYSVWRLIHSGQMSVIEEDVTLTVVDNLSSPFSWFGHIVAAEKDMQEFRSMILSHEMAHIRLRHSWDVIFMDVALCLWWFNPAMWLLRRELQSLHEYQADDAVLNGGVDAKSYQMMLIKRAVGSRLHSVANCLNHSNLNNRITMMCKKNSSRWAATKALLVVPMVAVAMGAFATTVYVPREVQDKVTENSVNDKDSKKSVLKISGEKIYLNDEQITIDQLKERVHAYNEISLQADSNTSMGVVADVKNVLRENGALKLTYEQTDEKPQPIYIVDGKVIPADDASKIGPNRIKSVNVFKSYKEELFSKFDITEEQAKNGVVVIELKKEGEGDDAAVLANATEDKVIVFADGQSKGESKTQSSTITILGNNDNTKMTTVQIDKAGENGEMKLKVNGKDVPYEMLKTIDSETIGKMETIKLDGGGTIYITTKDELESQKQNFEQQKDLAYIKVEKMPTFQGGDLNVFRNWVQSQIQYPAEAIEKNISGRVIFSFVVEKDGSTSDYTVLQTPDKSLADEVERIFKTCPKWEPGTQRGEKVRVKYTIPIVFAIQGNNAANEGLKVVGVKSQPKTAESEAAIAEFKKNADIRIEIKDGKETYFVNGKEVKKEDVGAYEPEKVVVDGAHSDGVKTVYIKVKK